MLNMIFSFVLFSLVCFYYTVLIGFVKGYLDLFWSFFFRLSVVCSLPIYPQELTRINRYTIIFVVIHIRFYFADVNPYTPRTYVDAARPGVVSRYAPRTYVD